MSFWKKPQAEPVSGAAADTAKRPPLVTPLNGSRPRGFLETGAASTAPKTEIVPEPPLNRGLARDLAAPMSLLEPTVPVAAPPQVTDEQRARMDAAETRGAAAFGEIVSVLMRTQPYRSMPLADLEWFVIPAIATGQCAITKSRRQESRSMFAVGVVLWASVSDEINNRLQNGLEALHRLKPQDWASGENIWLIEAVGEKPAVEKMLAKLRETRWQGKRVNALRRIDATGPVPAGSLS